MPPHTPAVVVVIARHADASEFVKQIVTKRKVSKLHFRASIDVQRALDIKVDRLCASRPGHNETLLLYGKTLRQPIFLVKQMATSKVQLRHSLMQRSATRRLSA